VALRQIPFHIHDIPGISNKVVSFHEHSVRCEAKNAARKTVDADFKTVCSTRIKHDTDKCEALTTQGHPVQLTVLTYEERCRKDGLVAKPYLVQAVQLVGNLT